MPRIRILIGKDGKVTIDAEGFVGSKCLKATQKLEELLSTYGIQLGDKKVNFKPEYYKSEVVEHEEIGA